MTDADSRCVIASGAGRGGATGGSWSLWPLHDTTCGPDLVPAFVNPLVVASAAVCVGLGVITIAARNRQSTRAATD